jgi:hypothetical protein
MLDGSRVRQSVGCRQSANAPHTGACGYGRGGLESLPTGWKACPAFNKSAPFSVKTFDVASAPRIPWGRLSSLPANGQFTC